MKRESKLSRKIYERVCQVKADERNEKKNIRVYSVGKKSL
jgi:hypothetical protein